MKALRIVCALLLITGACLSGRALYMHAKAELAGILVRRAWEHGVQSGKPQRSVALGGYASRCAYPHPAPGLRRNCSGRSIASNSGLRSCSSSQWHRSGRARKSCACRPSHQLVQAAGKYRSGRHDSNPMVRRPSRRIAGADLHREHDQRCRATRHSFACADRRRRADVDHLLSLRAQSAFTAAIHRARLTAWACPRSDWPTRCQKLSIIPRCLSLRVSVPLW